MTSPMEDLIKAVEPFADPFGPLPSYHAFRRLESALTAAKAALAETGWQPIETAPKDKAILVYAPGGTCDLPDLIGVAQWHEDAGFCIDEMRDGTHWHLLPEPPACPAPGAPHAE